MKTRVVIASFLTVLVTTAGLRAGSTARQDRIVRPGSDAPYFVAYSVTPPTLKDNRINFVRLYFKFHDDLFDLKGGLLNINFKYQSASGEPLTLFLPEAPEPSARPDRSSGAVLVPSGGRPTFVTYPLLEDVFKRQEGNFELWFGLLAENFGKVTIECWMRDGNGTNGTDTRQATLVRSTTPSGPKQGRNVG